MKKLLLVLGMVLFALGFTMAQRTITGTVTDESDEPLIGASVLVKGTSTGTVTDIDGTYSLNVPDGATTLVISYTGYTTQELELGVSNLVDVKLQSGVVLETAVVTALGVQRDEKALGYAVQEVGSDDINETNSVSFIDALSGKAAGVQVTQASGAAGASSRIVLRGQTSFNGDNEALIVIDGVRLDNSENNSERGLYGVANSNRGMDLNPNDIASVTVLKGAAAAALYGVEGARGVLLITTKKGQAGKTKVEFSSTYTVSEVNKMHDLDNRFTQGWSGQWAGPSGAFIPSAVSWGALADTMAWNGNSDYRWDRNGELVSQNDPSAVRDFEPYDNVDDFYQRGQSWNTNLSVSGGNDVLNYRFSFGHTNQGAVVPKNTFERTNAGLNLSAKLFDEKLSLTSSFNYVNSGGRRIQQGSNTSGINLGLLRTPISFDNANGFDNAENEPLSYQFPDGRQRNYRAGGGYDNPFWIVNLSPFNDRVNRLFGSLRLAYEFDQWATLSTTIGTDFYTDNRKQEFEVGSRTFPGGQIVEDQYNYRHIDAYVNLTGGGNIAQDFSLSYNLGMNLWDKFEKQNYVQGDGLNFFGFRELANTTSVISSVNHVPEKNISAFGSLDLGYKNFLYLTLTGRNDWVSTLIVPSKAFNASDISIFYPSASVSFVFSEFINSNIFSFGKLRFSYAQVGGGAPTPFSTGTIYNVPNNTTTIYSLNDGWTNGILFPFQGTAGYTFSPLQGNIDLVPSTTTDYEVGVDLRFLNGKIGLDATFYTRESTDQIIAINVPNSTGFQRAFINSGELATIGGEVVLNITPVSTPDWSWDVSFNFSTWETTVESLPEGVPNQYLDGFTGTGIYNIAPDSLGNKYEFGQILGNPFQRVNTNSNTFDPNQPFNPDGALIIDDSGSPDPNADDFNPNYGYPLADPVARVIGNPNPEWLLGINNTIRWKNLALSFLFDIKQGGDMWNGTAGALTFFGRTELTSDRDAVLPDGNSDYANATHVFDGVLASNGSSNSIRVPLDQNWYTGNGGGFGSVSEHFVEDASYARLRYLSLSYNFGSLINGLDDLTLSFTGRNLVLITDYTGFDPETSLVGSSSNGQGLEYFQMPGVRSYAVGVNVRF